MAPAEEPQPRQADEWRVEVHLDEEAHGKSLGDRLHALELDNEARERLGGSVIVTRDGPRMFLYAWHEQSAREAESMVRQLLEDEKLAAEVRLMRWHPVQDEWRPASEPLPEDMDEVEAEAQRHAENEALELAESGRYEWQVVVELPSLHQARDFARNLRGFELPVKRRWRYVIVEAITEEAAVELGTTLEERAPEGSAVVIRANPMEIPHPVFIQLGSLKPGLMRDLGI